jgi:MFS family permease
MDSFYIVTFALTACLAAFLQFNHLLPLSLQHGSTAAAHVRQKQRLSSSQTPLIKDFSAFKNNYLLVYSMMMAGDWLQGPYVYALYESYGFDRGAIGKLFIAGFGSSMVFGTFIGSLADVHGRKKAALAYVVTYTFGCFTKHFNSFRVLFIGRIFCGVATSLLYSAFESWLVAEHFKRGFDAEWLGSVFSQAVFLGNGLMAILAGLFAQSVVDLFGPVAPFDAASVVLLVGGMVIALTWGENYGGGGPGSSDGRIAGHDHTGQLRKAFNLIRSDKKILLLGLMQSLFEGSMYCFVFSWTPALSYGADIPHGMIFACFMVACMVGSALAGTLLQEGSTHRPEMFMQYVFYAAAGCLFVPVIMVRLGLTGSSLSDELHVIPLGIKLSLLAFCAFECLVGIFWPSMMSLRSRYVPEDIRSTIINCFRFVPNVLHHPLACHTYSLASVAHIQNPPESICLRCSQQCLSSTALGRLRDVLLLPGRLRVVLGRVPGGRRRGGDRREPGGGQQLNRQVEHELTKNTCNIATHGDHHLYASCSSIVTACICRARSLSSGSL